MQKSANADESAINECHHGYYRTNRNEHPTGYCRRGEPPHVLAKHRNYRIKASEVEIAKSLEGTWKEEHLFCLSQALSLYDTYQALISEADAKLEALIAPLRRQGVNAPKGKAKRGGKNAPGLDALDALREWAGVDLTQIGGNDVCTALTVLVELGTDLSKLKRPNIFVPGWDYAQALAYPVENAFQAQPNGCPTGWRVR